MLIHLILHLVVIVKKGTIIYLVMTIQDLGPWIGATVGIISIITAVSAGVRWLVKHYFDEIKKELKPNSGSSLKDQVSRLEANQEKMEQKIEKLYDTILDFMSKK